MDVVGFISDDKNISPWADDIERVETSGNDSVAVSVAGSVYVWMLILCEPAIELVCDWISVVDMDD